MKGLMKASCDGSAMWRGRRGIGSPRESMYECVLVVVQWVGLGRDGIDIVKECFRKRFLDVR